jgi:DNA-binding winged helix-turn-helix (wHTH) protein
MGYPPGSTKPFVFVDIPVYPLRLVSATRPSPRAVALYRFGPYEADVSRSELRKFGIPVRLERKPWLLLLALLDRAGEIATRLELRRLLWGDDVFVDFEAGLNVAIKKVRAALNDSADQPEYVETVAREGYRFVATVEQVFAAVSYPRTTSSAEHPCPSCSHRCRVRSRPSLPFPPTVFGSHGCRNTRPYSQH